ncbi:MAG: rhamnose transport system permease protein [Nocardioidaceae bacterium]|nr:rhamnose transport system permease protein [Nocardioidaceae bacterium]
MSDVSTDVVQSRVPAPAPADRSVQTWWRGLARWETGLVVVLVAVIVFGASESSDFLQTSTLFYLGINVGYIAIMALPMTFVVMTGEIDLSVASMLGLSGATVGLLWHHGWGIWPAFLVALHVGAIGGALNGVLVAKVGLPSIAVTIGTLTLFRGLAEILLGSRRSPPGPGSSGATRAPRPAPAPSGHARRARLRAAAGPRVRAARLAGRRVSSGPLCPRVTRRLLRRPCSRRRARSARSSGSRDRAPPSSAAAAHAHSPGGCLRRGGTPTPARAAPPA